MTGMWKKPFSQINFPEKLICEHLCILHVFVSYNCLPGVLFLKRISPQSQKKKDKDQDGGFFYHKLQPHVQWKYGKLSHDLGYEKT